MKPQYSILSLILFLGLLTSCAGNSSSKIEDFDNDIYTTHYSSGFDIKGAEGRESVIITSNNPWQGADGVSTRLFIARNGEGVPEGFTGQVLEGRPSVLSRCHPPI